MAASSWSSDGGHQLLRQGEPGRRVAVGWGDGRVGGLVIFGGYTIFDFNRLRRTGVEDAIPIAASIFLDILNVFLFMLELLGGEQS
jgi:hypothetical protein